MASPHLMAAMPSLSNRCGEKGVNFTPPDNATLVAFDEECKTAFIGPPQVGEISVDQVVGSSNLLFCDTVKLLPERVYEASQGMAFWTERLNKKSAEYDDLTKEVKGKKHQLAELVPSLNAKKKKLVLINEEAEVLRSQVSETRNFLDECKNAETVASECASLEKDLAKIKNQLSSKRMAASEAQEEIISVEYNIKRQENELKEIDDQTEKMIEDLEKYKRLLKSLENDAFEGYQKYGQLYGATASVLFKADWQKLIKEAQELNKKLKLQIQQLPLISTEVGIASTLPDGFNLTQMSALMDARIPGFEVNAKKKPQKINLEKEPSLSPAPWVTTITGQLDLNLIGACGMVDEKNKISLVKADEGIGAMLSVNLSHTYPMMMKRGYEISFSSNKIISQIESLVEEGGFFSSTKLHELVQHNLDSDKISIRFLEEGGRSTYTDKEEKEIILDVKYEIMDKILRGMNAIPQFSNEAPTVVNMEYSGAARFVRDNIPCYGYSICYAVGFIIGVAVAIFGSNDALTYFSKINSMNIKHSYRSDSPAYYMANATFKRKES